MRIVVFFSFDIRKPSAGGEERGHYIYSYLTEYGHQVTMAFMSERGGMSRIRNMKVLAVPYSGLVKKLFLRNLMKKIIDILKMEYGFRSLLDLGPSVCSSLKEEIREADVVIVGPDETRLFHMIYAKLMGKPVWLDMSHVQTATFLRRFWELLLKRPLEWAKLLVTCILEKLAFSLADKVVVSCWEDRVYATRLLRADETKIYVVEDGVDCERFRPDETLRVRIRKKLGFKPEHIVLAFIGNLKSPHNFSAVSFIVRKLAPKLFAKYDDRIRFLIVGPYAQLPRDFTADPRIIFTGFVEEPEAYLNASDICLAPITEGGGLKTKTLAYMACGKPVVTTPEGAMGIGIKNGEEAIVCGLDQVFNAVSELVENEELRKEMGKRARQKALKFSWKAQALKLLKCLEEALGGC